MVQLAGGLADRGWDTRVIAFAGGDRMEAALAERGVQVLVIKAKGPKRLHALVDEIRRSKPDGLVTFMLQANVLGRLAGLWTRTPVVSSIRNTRFGGRSRLGQVVGDILERTTARLAASIVINSEYAARELADRGVTTGANVIVIPNGVLLPANFPKVKSADADRPFTWLAVGRLVPQKNYQALVEGFQRVVAIHPEVRLMVAGEGSERPRIEAAIAQLKLDENIILLGERSDVPALLGSADAFILASGWEGMPNAVMEAMAHGLPTVATPVGGVPELIVDGETGWIAEGTDAAALSEAMLRVMSLDARQRASVAAKGSETIRAKFSMQKLVESWARVITVATEGHNKVR